MLVKKSIIMSTIIRLFISLVALGVASLFALQSPNEAYAQFCYQVGGTCMAGCPGGYQLVGGQPTTSCNQGGPNPGTGYCCVPYPNCNTGEQCTGGPPNNTCYNGNEVQQCYDYAYSGGGACNPSYAGTRTLTVNNCSGPGVCRNQVCIPWCSAGNKYTTCNADGRVGANTTCNTNNADENCTYTTAPGFGTNCVAAACANRACTFNSCNLPQYECLGGGPKCTEYFTISGNITDVDGNGTPSIPVNGAGCGSSGGGWTFGYGCKIKAGGYTVSEALPANYIPIGATSQGVTVGPNKAGVNFQVARVFSISGSVVDVDGNGTPAIPVTCAGFTASGGNFTFPYGDHIRRGNYNCSLALPANYIPIGPTSIGVTVGPDKTGVNFQVARVFSISGNITDVDGNGTPAIPVTCAGFTQSGGAFTFPYADHIRRGNYNCSIALPANYIAIGPTSIAVTVGPDRTGVNFTVARVFSITGSIVDVDGNGVPAIPVTCADTGPGGETATLTGGNFTFPYADHFRRGNVTCTLALPANYILAPGPAAITFAVGPDRAGVNFQVARVFSISGTVTDPYNGNAGVGGVAITSNGYTVNTNGAGAYTIPYAAHIRSNTNPHAVTLTIPNGWTNTTVTTQNVTVGPTADTVGINFGVTKLFSVSGNVFIDPNIDGIEEAGEVNYTAQISHLGYQATTLAISNFQPTPTNPFTTANGIYAVNQLITGPFTISYALPTPKPIWYMTSPIVGPPAAFAVNVGYTCNVNGAPGATCNNGNIVNLDFGIIDNVPWIESICGDMRNDGGVNDQIPLAHYALITNASCTGPGLAFTGGTDSDFGDGQASTTNQIVGGATYPEVYTSSSKITTSYTYLTQKAQTAEIPEIALSSVCNLTNCTLPANLAHGIYTANGDVTLNGYTFPANENYVFLINGNLTITGNIQIPAGSTATFSTAANITVTANVGSNRTSAASNLDGWYVAGNSFITDSTMPATCDQRLNVGGAVVINAQGTGGTLQNNRNLCAGNALYPSFSLTPRLDFLLNAPQFVQEEQTISQELAP